MGKGDSERAIDLALLFMAWFISCFKPSSNMFRFCCRYGPVNERLAVTYSTSFLQAFAGA